MNPRNVWQGARPQTTVSASISVVPRDEATLVDAYKPPVGAKTIPEKVPERIDEEMATSALGVYSMAT